MHEERNDVNLGFIVFSDEDVLDLEIAVNYRSWSLCMKVVHATYHSLSDTQLHWPLNLHRININLDSN